MAFISMLEATTYTSFGTASSSFILLKLSSFAAILLYAKAALKTVSSSGESKQAVIESTQFAASKLSCEEKDIARFPIASAAYLHETNT
jgi:hypothetical protein